MKLKINSDQIIFDSGSNLATLMNFLKLEEKNGIAVAINAEVISRKKWNETELQEEDEILIIEAAQGG